METVEVGPSFASAQSWVVVCATVGMRQGNLRASRMSVGKHFEEVRKFVGTTLTTVLSQHFSAGGGPFGGYHRSCYQTYTNKTLLARLQRDESKAESENNEESDVRRSQPWVQRRRSSSNHHSS